MKLLWPVVGVVQEHLSRRGMQRSPRLEEHKVRSEPQCACSRSTKREASCPTRFAGATAEAQLICFGELAKSRIPSRRMRALRQLRSEERDPVDFLRARQTVTTQTNGLQLQTSLCH